MKKKKYFILLIVFVVSVFIIYKKNIDKCIYYYWQNCYEVSKHTAATPPYIYNIRLINMVVMPILSVTFGILGYRLAKRKKRNPVVWALLCGLFNVIGYLILYNLNREK